MQIRYTDHLSRNIFLLIQLQVFFSCRHQRVPINLNIHVCKHCLSVTPPEYHLPSTSAECPAGWNSKGFCFAQPGEEREGCILTIYYQEFTSFGPERKASQCQAVTITLTLVSSSIREIVCSAACHETNFLALVYTHWNSSILEDFWRSEILMPVMLQERETPLHVNVWKRGYSVLSKFSTLWTFSVMIKKIPVAKYYLLCPAA